MTTIERLVPKVLAPDLAQALQGRLRFGRAGAGQILFSPGDPCTQFLILLEGRVRLQILSVEGREIALTRFASGESCPMTAFCMMGDCSYAAQGIAETDIAFAMMAREAFEDALTQSGPFRRFVFATLGTRLSQMMRRVEELTLERIDQRLARHLLRELPSGGERLAATHEKIARDLGSAREVVSRRLKAFERRNWVRLSRGQVEIIDRGALSKIAAHGENQGN